MIAAVIAGCGKPKSGSNSDPKESNNSSSSANNAPAKPNKTEAIAISMGPANNTRTKLMVLQKLWFIPLREELWFIEWQSANLAIVNGNQSGMMFKVHGNVFEKGKPAGEFFAERAEADKAADRLILDGGIKIISEKAVLKAKKVEWLADLKLFMASGEVTFDSPDGVVGPVDVLYASATLNKVASSLKYFKK